MAEEIRVTPTIQRGFVDVGRPGPTGLSALASALDTTADVGLKFAQQKLDQEVEETEKSLANPLVSDEEAREIEEEAFFPINKIKARNRVGENIVFRNRADIEDYLRKATDPVEARELLREKQAELLEKTTDLAEQAGIREAMASISPSLLTDASKERQATQARNDVISTISSQQHALEDTGSEGWVALFDTQLYTETLATDARTRQAFVKSAVDGLQNIYDSNPARGADILLAAKEKQSDKYLDPTERGYFGDLIDYVTREEDARGETITAKQKRDNSLMAAQTEIRNWIEEKGRTARIPDDLEARLYEFTDDPLNARDWLEDAYGDLAPMVSNTPEYKRAIVKLETLFAKDPLSSSFQNPAEVMAATSRLEQIMQRMGPAYAELPDQERIRILDDLVVDVHGDAVQILTKRQERRAFVITETNRLKAEGRQLKENATRISSPEGLKRNEAAQIALVEQLRALRDPEESKRRYDEEVGNYARSKGIELDPVQLLLY